MTKYKQTEIGKIPEEWEVVELDNLVSIQTGKRERGGALIEGEVLSLGGEHVGTEGKVIWGKDNKYITKEFYDKLKEGKVKVRDILIVKDGATTGKTAFVDEIPSKYMKVAINEHVFIIRTKDNETVDSKYLFYVLFSKIGQKQIRQNFHGMIGGILRRDVETIKIPKPKYPEQRAIAEILSTVDEAIQNIDKQIEKTERLKKGLMETLLIKGIGHKKFRDSEIGKIPDEWEVVNIEQLGEVVTGTTPPTKVEEYWDNGTYMFVTPTDYNNKKYINETERKVSQKGVERARLIPKNSVMVTCIASVGEVALSTEECITNQQINTIICNENVYPEFVYYLIKYNKPRLIRWAGITTSPIIKKSSFEKFPVPLPPLQEQRAIVEILSTVDNKLSSQKSRKQKLERIKQGLMDCLLTGKKRVRVVA